MNTKEILSIVALAALGLCLLCGLAKMVMKKPKAKQFCDHACNLLVFVAVVLVGVSQLLVEDSYTEPNSKYAMRDAGTIYLDFAAINTPTTNLPKQNIQISKITGMGKMVSQLSMGTDQKKKCDRFSTYTSTIYPSGDKQFNVNAFCSPLADINNSKWYSNTQNENLQNYNIFSPFINPDNTGNTSKGLGPFTSLGNNMYQAIVGYNLEYAADPTVGAPLCAGASKNPPVQCFVSVWTSWPAGAKGFGDIEQGDFVFSAPLPGMSNWPDPPGEAYPSTHYTNELQNGGYIYIYHKGPVAGLLPPSGWKMNLRNAAGIINDTKGVAIGEGVSIEFAVCNSTCPSINVKTNYTPVSSQG